MNECSLCWNWLIDQAREEAVTMLSSSGSVPLGCEAGGLPLFDLHKMFAGMGGSCCGQESSGALGLAIEQGVKREGFQCCYISTGDGIELDHVLADVCQKVRQMSLVVVSISRCCLMV